MKKRWSKPKLIVLVRGKPEEAVLQTCKAQSGYYQVSGPLDEWTYCRMKMYSSNLGETCLVGCDTLPDS